MYLIGLSQHGVIFDRHVFRSYEGGGEGGARYDRSLTTDCVFSISTIGLL